MKRLAAWLGLIGGFVTGCYVGYYDPYYWDYPYYDPYYYGYDAYFVFGWGFGFPVIFSTGTSGAQAVVDLDAEAASLAARAGSYFTPSTCVNATASGPTVNYVFTGCEGQFGVGKLSGKATLQLSENNGQVVLTARSSDLVIDDKPFVLDLTTTMTKSGNENVASVESHSHSPGQVDARHAQGTVRWQDGTDCVVVDGQGSATRGSLSTTSTVTGYQRCAQRCPSSGTVTVDGSSGVFEAQFDGSPTEQVTGPDGKRKAFDLQCR